MTFCGRNKPVSINLALCPKKIYPINGKVVKRAGVIVGADPDEIYAKAAETLTKVKKLAGW